MINMLSLQSFLIKREMFTPYIYTITKTTCPINPSLSFERKSSDWSAFLQSIVILSISRRTGSIYDLHYLMFLMLEDNKKRFLFSFQHFLLMGTWFSPVMLVVWSLIKIWYCLKNCGCYNLVCFQLVGAIGFIENDMWQVFDKMLTWDVILQLVPWKLCFMIIYLCLTATVFLTA